MQCIKSGYTTLVVSFPKYLYGFPWFKEIANVLASEAGVVKQPRRSSLTSTERQLVPTLIKKKKKNFLNYKEIQMGLGANSYMRKGFLIYQEMRKYLT